MNAIPSKFEGALLVPTSNETITTFETEDKRVRLYISSSECRTRNTFVLELGDDLGVATYTKRPTPPKTSVGWRVGFLEIITKTKYSTYTHTNGTSTRRSVLYQPSDFRHSGPGRRRSGPPTLIDTLVRFDTPCSAYTARNYLGLEHVTFTEQ